MLQYTSVKCNVILSFLPDLNNHTEKAPAAFNSSGTFSHNFYL